MLDPKSSKSPIESQHKGMQESGRDGGERTQGHNKEIILKKKVLKEKAGDPGRILGAV